MIYISNSDINSSINGKKLPLINSDFKEKDNFGLRSLSYILLD